MGRKAWLLAALLALCVCHGAGAAEPYTIDVILSQTGGGAFLGKAERKSLEILQGVVNSEGGIGGRPLAFAFSDDQSQPQLAVQLASTIIARHPAVMLGPALVATCNAVMPMLRAGPLTYCLTPGAYPPPGGFVFTAQPATRSNMEALLRYFGARGWTRIAFLNSADATGRDAEKDFDSVLQMPGNTAIQVVAREHFNPGDLTVDAQIQVIKQAAPQVLLAWSTGAPVATVLKAVANAGFDVPVVTTNGNQTYEQMAQYAGFLPRELYLPSTGWPSATQGIAVPPEVLAAQQRYNRAVAAAGVKPDSPLGTPWDPAGIVVAALRKLGPDATAALRKLGPDATAAQLRDAIAGLRTAGISGQYDFQKVPQRGLGADQVVITRWDAARQIWRVVSEPGGTPLPSNVVN